MSAVYYLDPEIRDILEEALSLVPVERTSDLDYAVLLDGNAKAVVVRADTPEQAAHCGARASRRWRDDDLGEIIDVFVMHCANDATVQRFTFSVVVSVDFEPAEPTP